MAVVVRFLEPAWLEFRDAGRYYEGIRSGLGEDFRLCVLDAVSRIQQFPLASPRFRGITRRCGVKRYPYGLIYLVENDEAIVIAVAHSRRQPNYWRARLNDI